MNGSIFDERAKRGHGCPVCGAKKTMAVVVQARRLDEKGKPLGQQISRQASYCQEHGAALYLKLGDEIGKKP